MMSMLSTLPIFQRSHPQNNLLNMLILDQFLDHLLLNPYERGPISNLGYVLAIQSKH
jgi:hypothetical protein